MTVVDDLEPDYPEDLNDYERMLYRDRWRLLRFVRQITRAGLGLESTADYRDPVEVRAAERRIVARGEALLDDIEGWA